MAMCEDASTRPPFKPECEVFYEGGPSPDQLCHDCEKNPGHPTFIPVKDFTLEHLPPECRGNDRHLDNIKCWCDRTVKVLVRYTSLSRPDTYTGSSKPYPYSDIKGNKRVVRSGTGFISSYQLYEGKPCPCPVCKESPAEEEDAMRRYLMANVQTATHVIYDDSEAASSTFECFYDSDNKESVKILHGLSARQWGIEDDSCEVVCVTHDEELIEAVCGFMKKCTITFLNDYGLIISHPHGRSKHITIGKFLYVTYTTDERFQIVTPREFDPSDRCRLISATQTSKDIQQTACDDPTSGKIHRLSNHEQHSCTRKNNASDCAASPIASYYDDISTKPSCDSIKQPTSALAPSISPLLCLDSDKNLLLELGVEYSFPRGSSFTLPKDSEYICRCRDPSSCEWWVTFPPGTKYTWPNGTDIPLTDDVEFKVQVITDYVLFIRPSYRSYAIDTCPGSSGAKVIFDRIRHPWSYALHAGTGLDGTNRTGTKFFCFHNQLSVLPVGGSALFNPRTARLPADSIVNDPNT